MITHCGPDDKQAPGVSSPPSKQPPIVNDAPIELPAEPQEVIELPDGRQEEVNPNELNDIELEVLVLNPQDEMSAIKKPGYFQDGKVQLKDPVEIKSSPQDQRPEIDLNSSRPEQPQTEVKQPKLLTYGLPSFQPNQFSEGPTTHQPGAIAGAPAKSQLPSYDGSSEKPEVMDELKFGLSSPKQQQIDKPQWLPIKPVTRPYKSVFSNIPAADELAQLEKDSGLDIWAYRPESELTKPVFPKWHMLIQFPSKGYDLSCRDCPKSFGSMLAISNEVANEAGGRLIKQCQGGLFQDDLFLTSRHCVPDDLLVRGKTCDGRIRFVFHQQGPAFPHETVECDQIVDFNDLAPGVRNEGFHEDWAIFKMKRKLPSRVVPVRTSGISEEDKLFLFLPLQNKDGMIRLTMVNCTAILKSYSYPSSYNSMSVGIATACNKNVKNGFSGSPVYVRGQSGWQQVAVKRSSTNQFILIPGGDLETLQMSYDTNVSCIPILNSNAREMESCEYRYPLRQHYRAKLIREELTAIKTQIDNELSSHPILQESPMHWQTVNKGNWMQLSSMYQSHMQHFYNYETEDKSQGITIYEYFEPGERYIYPQVTAPLAVQCINKKALRKILVDGVGKTKVPQVFAKLVKNAIGKLHAQYRIHWAPSDVYRVKDSPGMYLLLRRDEELELEDAFWKGTFSPFGRPFPACEANLSS